MRRVIQAACKRLSDARETIGLYQSWKAGRGYYPHTVELLVTAPCNCRCVFCNVWHPSQSWRRSPSKKELTLEQYVRLFDELAVLGTRLLFFSGGEPFLRSDIISLFRQAKKRGFQVLVSTNGGVLNPRLAAGIVESGVDSIAFSIDAPRSEVHDELRGVPGLWEKAVASMTLLRKAREQRGSKKPAITVWYLVSKVTIGLIGEMLEARERIGYDEIDFQPIVAKTPRVEDLLCSREDIQRLWRHLPSLRNVVQRVGLSANTLSTLSGLFLDPTEATRGRYASVINRNTLCFAPWLVSNIDPFGAVYPCCYANAYQNLGDNGSTPYWGDADYSLGDLTKQGFADIWNGVEYRQFRNRFRHLPRLPFCAGCGYQVLRREQNARWTRLFLCGSFWRKGFLAAARSTWRDLRHLFWGHQGGSRKGLAWPPPAEAGACATGLQSMEP